MRRRRLILSAAALPGVARAQAAPFPDRPVRLVVPYGPGGVVDVLARGLARAMSTALGGASVFVENKAGGATRIGTMDVATARPDGHSLLVIPPVAWIGYFHSGAYDRRAWHDLAPIAEFATTPYNAVMTRAGGGLDSWTKVVEKARRTPGGATAASPAFGGFVEFAFAEMLRRSGIEGTVVPFRGGGEMLTALLAGQVDFNVSPFAEAVARRRSGECHVVAVSSDGRNPILPDVPSFVELGIGEVLTNAYSVWAPQGLLPAIAARLSDAVRDAIADPAFADLMVNRLAFDLAFREGARLRGDLDALDEVWTPRLRAAFNR